MSSRLNDDRAPVDHAVSRRELLAAMASIVTLPLLSACHRNGASTPSTTSSTSATTAGAAGTAVATSAAGDAAALALLDQVGENLLRLAPEQATSLGIDTGARATLR